MLKYETERVFRFRATNSMEQFKGKYVRPWGDENIFGDRGLPAVEITAKEGDKWHIKMECPVMDIKVKLDEEEVLKKH